MSYLISAVVALLVVGVIGFLVMLRLGATVQAAVYVGNGCLLLDRAGFAQQDRASSAISWADRA